MAPSLDYAASSLLCAEDSTSIYCDEGEGVGYGVVVQEFEDSWVHKSHRIDGRNKSFNGDECLTGLPLQTDEWFALMIEKEPGHLPASDYSERLRNGDLDLDSRDEAVDWIVKVHAHFNFGPLCAYLATNYLDRFLSAYELPQGKAWMMQLLAVACLSLAAKMEETEVPLSLDLQVGDSKFVFEARTIQRMELLVLSTLRWRMQATTPFSFIDYFLRKLNGAPNESKLSIFRSTQLILNTMKGIGFLEFRPSEISAAVAMSVAGETPKADNGKSISLLIQRVDKERVLKCAELIHEVALMNCCSVKGVNASESCVPHSPIGVLDAACFSYKSDDAVHVGSCANSSLEIPASKRRKLNIPCEVEP